jgi:hypothetical protein
MDLMTIPEWTAIAAFGVIVSVLGWGYGRLIKTQDTLYQAVHDMRMDLVRLCGQLGMTNSLQEQNRELCDSRHDENIIRLDGIKEELDKIEAQVVRVEVLKKGGGNGGRAGAH